MTTRSSAVLSLSQTIIRNRELIKAYSLVSPNKIITDELVRMGERNIYARNYKGNAKNSKGKTEERKLDFLEKYIQSFCRKNIREYSSIG